MSRKSVHTVKTASGWGNKTAGASRVAKVYKTKAAAQAAGRKTAINKGAEHVIHNKGGKIAQSNSYGGDPHPPSG